MYGLPVEYFPCPRYQIRDNVNMAMRYNIYNIIMIVFTRAGVYNNPSVDDIERLFSSIVARFKPFAV